MIDEATRIAQRASRAEYERARLTLITSIKQNKSEADIMQAKLMMEMNFEILEEKHVLYQIAAEINLGDRRFADIWRNP